MVHILSFNPAHVRPEVGTGESRSAFHTGKDLTPQDPQNWQEFCAALQARFSPTALFSRTLQIAGLGLFGDALSVAGFYLARRMRFAPLATALLPILMDEAGSAAVTASLYRDSLNGENYTIELFEGTLQRGILQGALVALGGKVRIAGASGFLASCAVMFAGGVVSRWASHHLFGKTEDPFLHRAKFGWALEMLDTGMMLGLGRGRHHIIDVEGCGRAWVTDHVEPFGGFRGGMLALGGGRIQPAPQGRPPPQLVDPVSTVHADANGFPKEVEQRLQRILGLTEDEVQKQQKVLSNVHQLAKKNNIQDKEAIRGAWSLLQNHSVEDIQQMLDQTRPNLVDPLLGAFFRLKNAGVSVKRLGRLLTRATGNVAAINKTEKLTSIGFIYQVLMADTLLQDGLPIVDMESKLRLPEKMHTVSVKEGGAYSIIQDEHPPPMAREDAVTSDRISIEIKTAFAEAVELAPSGELAASKNRSLLREVLRMRDVESQGLRRGSMLVVVGPRGISPETVAILLGIHPTLEIRHYYLHDAATYLAYHIDPTVDGRRIVERRVQRNTLFRKVQRVFDPHPLTGNQFFIDLNLEKQTHLRRFYDTLGLLLGSPASPAETADGLLADAFSPVYWMGERLATLKRLSQWQGFSPFRKSSLEEAEVAVATLEAQQEQHLPEGMTMLDALRRLEPTISAMAEPWHDLLKTELKGLQYLVSLLHGKDPVADPVLKEMDQSLSRLEENTFGAEEWTPEDAAELAKLEGIFETNLSNFHAAARAADPEIFETPNPVPPPGRDLRLSDFSGQAMAWLATLAAKGERRHWTNILEHVESVTQIASRSSLAQREGMIRTLLERVEKLQREKKELRVECAHLLKNLAALSDVFREHKTGAPRALQHAFIWLSQISNFVMEKENGVGEG